jgi:3-oxoacyl-[acyl-carrier protein] reductase
MGLLRDKVALVTGAGNAAGIGFAAARQMSTAGAKVVLTDIGSNFSELRQRVTELQAEGIDALALELDVTDQVQANTVIQAALAHYGRLDAVFNNAGYAGGIGPFEEITDAQFNLSWQVNVMGIVSLCRAALPAMRAGGGGSIINNSSLAGIGVVANMSGYSASKFAVVGLTKSLAAEFGKDNIRVNAVCPGMVWTDMGRAEMEFLREPGQSAENAKAALAAGVSLQQRWAEPREIGDTVVYLASDLSSYVSGIALPVAGGLAPGL